jgi:hypothetical protein
MQPYIENSGFALRGPAVAKREGNEPMFDTKTRDIARMLMRSHGLQALAVAQEHAAQARAQGDTAATEQWSKVSLRVQELRGADAQAESSATSATAPSAMR